MHYIYLLLKKVLNSLQGKKNPIILLLWSFTVILFSETNTSLYGLIKDFFKLFNLTYVEILHCY